MKKQTLPGYRNLRRGRRSISGQCYLLTTATHQRHPFFASPETARLASKLASAPETWTPSLCLGWVIMPDHWHGLVQLADGASLASTMQRFKGACAHAINQATGTRGEFWQKGYHERALRHYESLGDVLRYIVANPIRAGLVGHPLDYPYWDSVYATDPGWLHDLGDGRG
jgi:REP element-mobilizing transposase RayT